MNFESLRLRHQLGQESICYFVSLTWPEFFFAFFPVTNICSSIVYVHIIIRRYISRTWIGLECIWLCNTFDRRDVLHLLLKYFGTSTLSADKHFPTLRELNLSIQRLFWQPAVNRPFGIYLQLNGIFLFNHQQI